MIEGQKIVDISSIIAEFVSTDDGIESFTGSIGEGKTYGAVRRIRFDLLTGNIVYTNIWINVELWNGDDRKSISKVLKNTFFGRKRFYSFDLKRNYHYFDMDDETTWVLNGRQYSNVVDFIADISYAKVYLDEGQDIFDSYEGTNISKKKRKTLTRTRHFHRTIVVISQRYMAIPPTARANVKVFYKHVKVMQRPWLRFKVFATSEIDDSHVPVFDMEGASYDKYWGEKQIFQAYDTYELSKNVVRSQPLFVDAYDFSFLGKMKLLFSFLPAVSFPQLKLWKTKALRKKQSMQHLVSKSLGVKFESSETTIKIRKSKLKDLLPVPTGEGRLNTAYGRGDSDLELPF